MYQKSCRPLHVQHGSLSHYVLPSFAGKAVTAVEASKRFAFTSKEARWLIIRDGAVEEIWAHVHKEEIKLRDSS